MSEIDNEVRCCVCGKVPKVLCSDNGARIHCGWDGGGVAACCVSVIEMAQLSMIVNGDA